MDTSISNAQQAAFFRAQGYLRAPAVVPTDMIAALLQLSDKLAEEAQKPCQTDASGTVVKISQVVQRHPLLLDLARSPCIVESLRPLLGDNIELLLNRHNHLTYNRYGMATTRFHRDVLWWAKTTITVIVYLDQADVDNGCSRVIPGSHHLRYVARPNNGGTWLDEHSDLAPFERQALPVPMVAGGVLMIDACTFHAAGLNRSDRSRRSITFAYQCIDELADPSSHSVKRMLVAGESLYKGNDGERPPTTASGGMEGVSGRR